MRTGIESIPLTAIIRPRILIIEDHPAIRTAIRNLIRQAGAEVVAARDCEEGFNYLLSRHFHVLLTDVNIRTSNGNEFLQRCAGLPTIRRPSRVILFSHMAGDGTLIGAFHGDLTRAYSLGVLLDMFDGKPN
jgi:CheY-like chemotaxis protein